MSGRSWRDVAPCGTDAAFQRHVYARRPVDDACRQAHNRDAWDRRWRARAAAAGVSAQVWDAMSCDEREDLAWSLRIRPVRNRDGRGRFATGPEEASGG